MKAQRVIARRGFLYSSVGSSLLLAGCKGVSGEQQLGSDLEAPGEGVFVRLLKESLEAEGLDISIKGVDDHRQEETTDWVLARLSSTRS